MPSEAEAATLPIPEFADATIGQSEFVATAIATSKQWRLAIGVVAVSTIVFAIEWLTFWAKRNSLPESFLRCRVADFVQAFCSLARRWRCL